MFPLIVFGDDLQIDISIVLGSLLSIIQSLTHIPPCQGYGLLLCCVVARSDAKLSCMLCCGVVGLWCVCVCFIGRVGPKKLQKLLRSPTSTKT